MVLCSSVYIYIYIYTYLKKYVHTVEPAPVICDSRPLFFAFENSFHNNNNNSNSNSNSNNLQLDAVRADSARSGHLPP